MLSVVDRRFENISILIVPSLVQGDQASRQIVEGIDYLNSRSDIDLIIISRGGGSIEDLWPFNEEEVVRAVDASKIPVISGVGHETDFTITDFVADLRAPTPSAAAELAIANREEIEKHLDNLSKRLLQNQRTRIENAHKKLASIAERRLFKKPSELFIDKMQNLDELSRELKYKMEQTLNKSRQRFNILSSKIDALSPLKTIKRGYSITYDQENNLISDINQLEVGQELKTTIINGDIISSVQKIEENGGLDE